MEGPKLDFAFTSNHLENTPDLVSKASPEVKLKLYGLFKQATCGECLDEAPSMFNLKAKMKHDAWLAQSGMSKDEACEAYTRTVLDLDPTIKLPSSKKQQQQRSPTATTTTTPVAVLKGSNHSLSAMARSESKDFLDRLLGPPPRLTSPSIPSRGGGDEDTEEKSSSNGSPHVQHVNSNNNKKRPLLQLARNPSVEELKKLSSLDQQQEGFSSASSVVTTSAPTTPSRTPVSSSLVQPKMRKVSSLTWAPAADESFTPRAASSTTSGQRRRKSEGDEFDLAGMDDDEEDEDSSDMEWDNESLEEEDRKRRSSANIFSDEDDSDSDSDEDDDQDYEDEDADDVGFDESRLRRSRHRSSVAEDEEEDNETILGTFLFTMPFVFLLKVYHFISSVFMFPLTTAVQFLGFKVKKAPDTTSVREKKQAASMLLLASMVPLTPIMYLWMFFFLIFPLTTLPTAAYLAWVMYWDESPRNGSRRPLLKDVPLAKYFVEYFPITLWRKSVALDPKRKYVFAYHPHGIIGLGSFGAFATHAAGFQEKFPGIDIRLLTLDSNFKVPILREILLGFGVCSCSRKSCNTILQRGPGSAICLVVGGAAESLETQRGTYRLVLGRKGFVQVAVENDADLVPVIAFGETDAFETFSAAPGTALRAIQDWIQKKIKFTVPIFWGRGMFNTNFGFMPKRRPIHVVTGEPLQVKPFRDQGLEGEELVNAVHRAYVAALRRLFDENKDECEPGIKRKESLTIIK